MAVAMARPSAPSAPLSPRVSYRTRKGRAVLGTAEQFLDSAMGRRLHGKVQLVFTSPPFPLNRKKKYGNLTGPEYTTWLAGLAARLAELLTPTGSIVMELGNAWEPGKPIMSTLALKSLLEFLEHGELNLCQQFVCYNPARLPSPAQWVTIDRIRVKDAYTHVWWMSPVERPKANNANILKKYSPSMVSLLTRQKYNSGPRPSQHHISKTSFLTRHGGAIPPNVLTFTNTGALDGSQVYCRAKGLTAHPARMPIGLAEFFIKFLTDENDLVLDPFSGSNTTGAAAEQLKRRWVAIEQDEGYLRGSRGRFRRVVEAQAR